MPMEFLAKAFFSWKAECENHRSNEQAPHLLLYNLSLISEAIAFLLVRLLAVWYSCWPQAYAH